ncbi:MAG: glutathione S-transferase family protein [Candidatus Omnitrophota bacterium]
MLKIYGADLSSYANKVRMTAYSLGLEFDYQKVSLRDGEHRKPDYLAIHPAGKIPAMDDDGFVLFESNAIIKYLADKHNSSLYPQDRKKRALIDQWMDFTTFHIGASLDRVAFNRIFAPRIGSPVDERSIKVGISFLNRFLPVLDEQLKKNKCLAGEDTTLADINLVASLDAAEAAGVDLSKYENLWKHLQDLRRQDFYIKCHRNYKEKLNQVFQPPKS